MFPLDITYIRCLDSDCSESIESQLTLTNRTAPTRSSIAKAQVVINPKTDLPVFHLTGSTYPADIPVYMFVACQDIECTMSEATYLDYGARFGLKRAQVTDLFVDDEGTAIASVMAVYQPANQTILGVIRMAQSDQPDIEAFTFVKPSETMNSY